MFKYVNQMNFDYSRYCWYQVSKLSEPHIFLYSVLPRKLHGLKSMSSLPMEAVMIKGLDSHLCIFQIEMVECIPRNGWMHPCFEHISIHWYNVGKTMPSAPSPSHHHFYRWHGYHSQSWVVYYLFLVYPDDIEWYWSKFWIPRAPKIDLEPPVEPPVP
jgi:hypothetical protein